MKPDVKANDVHIIINDWESTRYIGEAKCYNAKGDLRWVVPALCKGIEGPRWSVRNGDTPPGLYKAGEIVESISSDPAYIWNAYGRFFIDLVECSGQESSIGRAGIGWHGGGTAAPDPLAPHQQLVPTLGCVRSYNADLQAIVIPTLEYVRSMGGATWITVHQIE